jgi:hypothetical protein
MSPSPTNICDWKLLHIEQHKLIFEFWPHKEKGEDKKYKRNTERGGSVKGRLVQCWRKIFVDGISCSIRIYMHALLYFSVCEVLFREFKLQHRNYF